MSTNPRLQEALHRAVGLENDGSLFEAEQIFRQLTARPNPPDLAHYQYGQFLLRRGDYAEAWPHFMKRIDDAIYSERSAATISKPYLTTADLDDIHDKIVLVYCDQGIGDAIMCARFIPLLAARAKGVVLTVFQGFRELFASLADIGKVMIIEFGDPLPTFDLHADLFSLPAIFETTPETIPPADWLKADMAWKSFWQSRLPETDGLKVGLVWQGNASHNRDEERSARLADLAPLAATGYTFYSLQAGPGAEQISALPDSGWITRFEEIENGIDEPTAQMVNCAALIDCLDLLITVDTAMAHIAGSLGKPVWVMVTKIPYWVFMLDGDKTPWYPSARVFRASERYAWDNVITEMKARLSGADPLAS